MKTIFVRGALGGMLAIAAPALPAASPVDGGQFVDSNTAGIESSFAPELDCRISATEEVVVYGRPNVLRLDGERLKTEMREAVRVVNERLKASIEIELKELALPKVELASSEVRSAVDLPPA